jgi:hypothetical protein
VIVDAMEGEDHHILVDDDSNLALLAVSGRFDEGSELFHSSLKELIEPARQPAVLINRMRSCAGDIALTSKRCDRNVVVTSHP